MEGLKYHKDFLSLLQSSYIETSLLNILMLIPLGIYLPWLFKLKLKDVIKTTFILVLIIEITQFISNVLFISTRSFNIDDFILNILGAIIGFGIYKLIMKPLLNPKIIN